MCIVMIIEMNSCLRAKHDLLILFLAYVQ